MSVLPLRDVEISIVEVSYKYLYARLHSSFGTLDQVRQKLHGNAVAKLRISKFELLNELHMTLSNY